jgi:hypothetical protein
MSSLFNKLSKHARLAASIKARGFLAPTACSHCVEIAQLCYISSASSRCSQCVLDHRTCSHSDDIDRMLFLLDIVAYQSFVAVQQCLTRLHELRAQRTRLSPMVASSEHTRYDLFLFGKNSRPTGLVMMMLNLFVALMTF